MNLDIKKDKRALGYFFHKSRGFNCKKTKRIACMDISKEFEINYIPIEYKVLIACSCKIKIFQINTNFL